VCVCLVKLLFLYLRLNLAADWILRVGCESERHTHISELLALCVFELLIPSVSSHVLQIFIYFYYKVQEPDGFLKNYIELMSSFFITVCVTF